MINERNPAAPGPSERRLIAQVAAHTSWANTADRSARTAPARRALEDKFLQQAEGDPFRAESLRRAYYAQLTLRSVKARRGRREDSTRSAGC